MCPHAVESTEGRTGKNWEEAQEEDGHPGGGRQAESSEVTTEGGVKQEKPGWIRRRKEPGR